MLNLNYNINQSGGAGNCRGEVKFNYSASIYVIGGGGGGGSVNGTANPNLAGGGGGAGALVSASISIIPNVTYTIFSGLSGSRDTDGGDSYLFGFDDNDTNPIQMYAQGGRKGVLLNGGNAGSGSVVRVTSTQLFPALLGGSGSIVGGTLSAGGGASPFANGGVPGATAGPGGAPINLFSQTGPQNGGGGGGGRLGLSPGGGGENAGNGGNYQQDGANANSASFGSAGGGAGSEPGGGGDSFGGWGSKGGVFIRYAGEPKAIVTNATTYVADGFTLHVFNTGSGTFTYPYPYPWTDVVPYTVEVCPDEHNEDVRPEIYWDLTYSTIQSRFPAVPVIVSSSYATMSIDAVNSNCINVTTTNNSVFTTNAQSTVKASLTGSNWPSTGSVTMSLSVAGITYDPLSTNQFYSASFSASSNVYNSNPSITGSIISSSFIASEFYRFYIDANVIHRFGGEIPRNGLIQVLDASNPASYPGSGSIWYDISGYNHNMSSSFGATFPSYNNNQFNFNGINNALSTFITSSLNAFSLVTWTKIGSLAPIPTSSRSGGAYTITSGSGNLGTQFDSLTFDENRQDKWEIATENNFRDVRSSVVETDTTDYLMISMTNAGLNGTQKLYRNATLVASGSLGSQYPNNSNLVLVGNRYYTPPSGSTSGSYAPEGFYTGSIVSCLLYNRELSDLDILDIFNAGAFTD
jgi:hypothetical protein